MTTAQQARCLVRVGRLLTGWGTVGVCYTAGRLSPRTAQVIHEGALDRMIPFDTTAVWLYLSFFLFVPAAYLLCAPGRLMPLTRAMQLTALLAAVVFVIWPTTLAYPSIDASSLSAAVLLGLAGSDSTQNCLPSLHGALTLLCIVALWERRRPWQSAMFLLWGAAIMLSVVATRRHLFIDLAAGVALGACCAWLIAYRLKSTTTSSRHEGRALLESGQET